jgi:hypothetical protein
MSITAMKQALEALEYLLTYTKGRDDEKIAWDAITDLRQAIEQAEKQEPVAWVCYGASEKHDIDFQQDDIDALPVGTQLYTTPPAAQREWVGLTDDEIWEAYMKAPLALDCSTDELYAISRTVEAKLRSKNNG